MSYCGSGKTTDGATGDKDKTQRTRHRLRTYHWTGSPRFEGGPPNYAEPFYEEDVAQKYPFFIKDMVMKDAGSLRTYKIDPERREWR